MNQRISFFTLETTLTTKEIVSLFISMRYTEDKSSGFMLSKVNGSRINAKHIYKYEKTNEIVTPFGDIKTTIIEEYYINEFVLHDGYIEIINPAKSLSHFRRDILKALNGNCKIYNIEVDLKEFIRILPSQLESNFYVSSLDIHSKKIIDSSTLKLSLTSNKDTFNKVNEFLPYSNYDLKRLSIKINDDMTEVELSSRGSIKFTGKEANELDLKSIIRCLLICGND
ncbi:hypothetical protein ACS6BV_002543 [Vibrio alginolyticus]